ncbi:hypothetical protein LRAMOSA05773 [Lichtheimia ramosa]|uniref:Thiamine pyrophosphokinase n=1 Tax=Lichtheimia ramosa TaxID=688394 RepID=A0A077X3M1_9FUNG|nr:hypothetical protein LRAMOSA05773 [Lichtheimia ramosa]
MNGVKLITHWCPSNILAADFKARNYCLILLNQPIQHVERFHRLWTNASLRYCADGAANRLYDAFSDDEQKREFYIPDEIAGDLDSLRDDVREYYEKRNVKVTRYEEQMTTDFDKCIRSLKEREAQMDKMYDIVAAPTLSGRFDQIISNINTLYRLKDQVERRAVLVSNENLTVLLDKGTHQIHCQPDYEGPTCGIIPMGVPATLTTHGLEWNLDHQECFFGGIMSTSNRIAKDTIEIKTSAPVVWTIEIKEPN